MTLSGEESIGNLFAFDLSSHQATAGSLPEAIGILPRKAERENWIMAELKEVL